MRSGKVHIQQQFEQDDPLFSLAFHPESNLYATGFASGQVTVQSYSDDGSIDSKWTTKRHKSSCRALFFDQEGENLYSTGTDKVIKRADAETGKVVGKNRDSLTSDPTVMLCNESFLLVGDEDANLSVFDNRTMKRVYYFEGLHEDNITSIVDWPFKNKYHFLTSGGTTVTHIDIRQGKKAIKSQSEDQEDEILSGCLASNQHSVFGMSEGVVTIWKNDFLEDQQNRMRLSDESIDCVIAGEEDHEVYAGGADGYVRKVNIHSSRVEPIQFHHSKTEEVAMLDFDYEYRLVSAGMDQLKIWKKEDELEDEKDEDEDEEEDEGKSRKRRKQKKQKPGAKKQKHGIAQFADL